LEYLEQVYRDRLPIHAYSTNDLTIGVRMLMIDQAIKKSIIQHNPKHSLGWLVYDMDTSTSVLDWSDNNCPDPNLMVVNKDNGHCHLFYGLDTPVHNNTHSSQKALRYLAGIDVALTLKLGADPGYSKLLSKNPLNDKWYTIFHRKELYTLDELAEWVDLTNIKDKRKSLDAIGYGRNWTLFNNLRTWAYRERRQGYLSQQLFHEAVLIHAHSLNADFIPLLPHSEIRSTAKSVSQWTWKRMSDEGYIAYQRTMGKLSGIRTTAIAEKLRAEIVETFLQCPKLTQFDIACIHGVSRVTVNKHLRIYKKSVKATISDKHSIPDLNLGEPV